MPVCRRGACAAWDRLAHSRCAEGGPQPGYQRLWPFLGRDGRLGVWAPRRARSGPALTWPGSRRRGGSATLRVRERERGCTTSHQALSTFRGFLVGRTIQSHSRRHCLYAASCHCIRNNREVDALKGPTTPAQPMARVPPAALGDPPPPGWVVIRFPSAPAHPTSKGAPAGPPGGGPCPSRTGPLPAACPRGWAVRGRKAGQRGLGHCPCATRRAGRRARGGAGGGGSGWQRQAGRKTAALCFARGPETPSPALGTASRRGSRQKRAGREVCSAAWDSGRVAEGSGTERHCAAAPEMPALPGRRRAWAAGAEPGLPRRRRTGPGTRSPAPRLQDPLAPAQGRRLKV